MRIVVLSSHTPSLFWFRMDMMKHFLDLGCEVYAVANEPQDLWADRFEENGIKYRQITVQRNGKNPLADLKTLSSIKSVFKELQPDVVFTYQAKTVIYGGIAAHRLGIPEVYSLIAGIGSVFLKDDLRTRLVRRIMITEYRIGMKHNRAVFFQNEDDEAIFRRYGIIKKQKTVQIAGSGVNIQRFQVLPLGEQTVFLCISRLIRDKGVMEYLQAARAVKEKHPEVRFLLVGPFDSNPSAIRPDELQTYIDDETIEYYGEQSDVRPFLGQCTAFVLPSYREGTPKTNLEAMACGRAVITTDTPGCRETVRDGENGFLVPVRDADALREKMEYFIANPGQAAFMGAAGRRMVEQIFDVELVNDRISRTMGLGIGREAEKSIKS